jgi:hypothetical protein
VSSFFITTLSYRMVSPTSHRNNNKQQATHHQSTFLL